MSENDKYLRQYFVAISAAINMFAASVAMGWSSPSLPKLLADDSPVLITRYEASWVTAFLLIGCFSAPIPAAYIMDRFGRKTGLLLGAIPNFTGWMLIAFADTFAMFLIARFFNGLSVGWMYVVLPIYLAEIASTKIRGSVSVITIIGVKTGILFAYIVGHYFSVSEVGCMMLVFPITFVLIFARCPETPYYLLDAQDTTKAHNSLTQLRGHSDVQEELDQIQTIVDFNQRNRPNFQELISPQNQQSLLILISLTTVGQLNSSNSIMAYAEIIFDYIGSDFPAGYSTIILGIVELVASVCGLVFMDKFGRRRILFVSIIFAISCNLILTIYFWLQISYDVSSWTWIPITAIMVVNAFSSFGMLTMSVIMLGEIFPKHLKGVAGIVLVLSNSLSAFVAIKMCLVIIDSLGYNGMFGIFTIICLVYTPLLWCIVPETKGKSFQVILDELRDKSQK